MRQTKKKPPTSIRPPVSIFATSPPSPGWAHKWQPEQGTQSNALAKNPEPKKTSPGKFSFQRAHFPVDATFIYEGTFHFNVTVFENLTEDLKLIQNCFFLIFSWDSHRPRTGHWQLVQRLITDLPLWPHWPHPICRR